MGHRHQKDFISGLERLFNPKSIALVGASTGFGKWGQLISSNIIAGGYQGKIFLVNPGKKEMFGLPVFEHIGDIQDPVDLTFIITPAKTVPSVLMQCGDQGVKGAVIITSGFSETGQDGKALEQEVGRKGP